MIKLIPRNKIGLGIFVFCSYCKKRQSNNSQCTHKDKWKYKADIKISGNRYTKLFVSLSFDNALKEFFDFKDSLYDSKRSLFNLQKKKYTIRECIEKYFQKVNCKNEFQVNSPKSRDHQHECIRVLNRFIESLENLGIDTYKVCIEELPISILDSFYNNLRSNYNVHSNSGIDRHTRIMRHFYSFLMKVNMFHGSNIFKVIETKPIQSNPTIITDLEYETVLKVINHKNGHIVSRGGTRNQYKHWLKDAIIIGRHTGLRREEIYNLRWDDIFEKEGNKFFYIIDLKVTRSKGVVYSKAAPITKELELRLEKIKIHSNSEKIIDSGLAQSSFKDNLSRAFGHFYTVAFPDLPKKQFKHLRKLHVTELKSLLGDEAYLASGHSNNRVIDRHYINRIDSVTRFSKLKNMEMNTI